MYTPILKMERLAAEKKKRADMAGQRKSFAIKCTLLLIYYTILPTVQQDKQDNVLYLMNICIMSQLLD